MERFSVFDIRHRCGCCPVREIRFDIRWERGETRSKTSLIDVSQAVEQTLDLFFWRPLSASFDRTRAGISGSRGTGRIQSDAVLGEREQLLAAQQSLLALRPSAGIKYVAGSAALGVGWALTWATGEWFEINKFGSEDGSGPPERSGILSHGIEITVMVFSYEIQTHSTKATLDVGQARVYLGYVSVPTRLF